MANHSFDLFGKNTHEILPVGYGTLYRRNWSLSQHPGPKIDLLQIGGNEHKLLYLYPQHLSVLYDRFALANPEGLVIEIDGAYEEKWTPPNLSPTDIDELHERRQIFVNLILDDASDGYPHLRNYLPEIFQSSINAEMGKDPWLNASLLASARKNGVLGSSFEDQLTEHPRWSKKWADYCKGLTG